MPKPGAKRFFAPGLVDPDRCIGKPLPYRRRLPVNIMCFPGVPPHKRLATWRRRISHGPAPYVRRCNRSKPRAPPVFQSPGDVNKAP